MRAEEPAVVSRSVSVPRLRREQWRRLAGVAAVSLLVAGIAMATIRAGTALFMPADGAHYIADADALFGQGVRELRHPPLFPALVGLVRPVVGENQSFLWALMISLSLLPVSLFLLLRRWLAYGPSLFAAALGSVLPIVAEVLGWGGGATLLGTVLMVFTFTAFERWLQLGGRRGFGVGALIAAVALTHAFPFFVTVIALAIRWAFGLWERRRIDAGWDAFGLRGIASVALIALPGLLLALPLYFGPSSRVQPPDFLVSWDLLQWAIGYSAALLLLLGIAIVGLQVSEHRGLLAYGIALAAMLMVFPAILRGHASYANRIEYVLPILLALGLGSLADVVAGTLRRRLPRLTKPTLLLVLLVGYITVTTFLPRLGGASRDYNQWVSTADLPIMDELRAGEGTVATSWKQNDISDGVLLSWVVEGLAKRPAFGPADAFLASVPEQFEGGLATQRLFAGSGGFDNGAVQVAAAPLGSRADMSVSVMSAQFYYPFLYVRSALGSYPGDIASMSSTVGDDLVWTFLDEGGRPVLERRAWLERKTVTILYQPLVEADPARPLSVFLSAPDGSQWNDVTVNPHSATGYLDARGELIDFVLSAPGARIRYLPPDTDGDLEGEAFKLTTGSVEPLEVQLRFRSAARAGSVRPFDQKEIIARYDMTNVLVLRNTNWAPRFDLDPCYGSVRRGTRMVLFEVRLACGTGQP